MKRQGTSIALVAAVFLIPTGPCRASTDSLLHNPEAAAAVEQNKQLNAPIEKSFTSPQPKSSSKAFLFSAVVPGAGEFYSGAKRGIGFAAAEVAFWTVYIALHGQAGNLEDDYIGYVDEHIRFEEDSPVASTETWTLEDYEHATQSDNWHYVYTEENGKPVARVGKFYWDDLPEDRIDQPGSVDMVSQSRAEAYEKRNATNDKFKQAKFILGLVVANHVVSAIDARICAISYNKRVSESGVEISLHPAVSPSGHIDACLALRRQF